MKRSAGSLPASGRHFKGRPTTPSDSVKRHLPIEYAADLTPVVASKEAGASWNARGMAKPLDFSRRKEYGVMASGRHPERLPDTTKAGAAAGSTGIGRNSEEPVG